MITSMGKAIICLKNQFDIQSNIISDPKEELFQCKDDLINNTERSQKDECFTEQKKN